MSGVHSSQPLRSVARHAQPSPSGSWTHDEVPRRGLPRTSHKTCFYPRVNPSRNTRTLCPRTTSGALKIGTTPLLLRLRHGGRTVRRPGLCVRRTPFPGGYVARNLFQRPSRDEGGCAPPDRYGRSETKDLEPGREGVLRFATVLLPPLQESVLRGTESKRYRDNQRHRSTCPLVSYLPLFFVVQDDISKDRRRHCCMCVPQNLVVFA